MRARGVDGSNVPSVYGFIAGAGAGAGYSCKAVTSSQCPHEGTSFRRHQHALLQVFSMAGGTLEWRLAWGSRVHRVGGGMEVVFGRGYVCVHTVTLSD